MNTNNGDKKLNNIVCAMDSLFTKKVNIFLYNKWIK